MGAARGLLKTASLHDALLAWYDAHHRDLPWRGSRDPYAIWVSEIMLQQTRVETVIPYFLRWMERFPDVAALAAAPEDEVLRAWAGLGYYSRARNLHAAARALDTAGAFPRHREGLRMLPGIGAYTSGAIASIAFGERVPAVDGNVLRVLARLLGDDRDLRDGTTRRDLEAQAARLVPEDRPGDWNQAVMELGATVCVPGRPRCEACPLSTACAAHRDGRTHELPVLRPKAAPREEPMHFAWIERDRHLLLVRTTQGGLLRGLWGLPGGHTDRSLPELVAEQTTAPVEEAEPLAQVLHRFTHRTWTMTVHAARLLEAPTLGPDARWVPLAMLPDEAVSTAHRKAIGAVLAARHDDDPTASPVPAPGPARKFK